MHGLEDPISHLPYKKPTTVRTSKELVMNKTSKMCDRNHNGKGPKHEEMQGTLPGGKSRTQFAQEYTKQFCTNVVRDFKEYLQQKCKRVFPLTRKDLQDEILEEELATEDPYAEPPEEEEGVKTIEQLTAEAKLRREAQKKEFLEPKPKRMVKPLNEPKITIEKQPEEPPKRTQRTQPTRTPGTSPGIQPERRELEQAWKEATEEDIPLETLEKLLDKTEEQPAPKAPEPLPLSDTRPMLEEDAKALNVLKEQAQQRLSPGAATTIQVGPRMKILQELFGTPHGKRISLAILTRLPPAIAPPEPLIARANVEFQFVATLDNLDSETWIIKPWRTPVFDTRY
jgi:hypothetical protein